MSYCDIADHERFRGVFFAKDGCLACELEQTAAMNRRAVRVMVRAFQELNTIRARDGAPPSVDPDYFSSIVDELDEVVIEMTGESAHCHPALGEI